MCDEMIRFMELRNTNNGKIYYFGRPKNST